MPKKFAKTLRPKPEKKPHKKQNRYSYAEMFKANDHLAKNVNYMRGEGVDAVVTFLSKRGYDVREMRHDGTAYAWKVNGKQHNAAQLGQLALDEKEKMRGEG